MVEVSRRDYVRENALEAAAAQPRRRSQRYDDGRQWLCKDEYGLVPQYLQSLKLSMAEQQAADEVRRLAASAVKMHHQRYHSTIMHAFDWGLRLMFHSHSDCLLCELEIECNIAAARIYMYCERRLSADRAAQVPNFVLRAENTCQFSSGSGGGGGHAIRHAGAGGG